MLNLTITHNLSASIFPAILLLLKQKKNVLSADFDCFIYVIYNCLKKYQIPCHLITKIILNNTKNMTYRDVLAFLPNECRYNY